MKMAQAIPINMLAPCGMNCWVCYVHLKKKKPCLGCNGQDGAKPQHCRQCEIKDCTQEQGVNFCYECSSFPCAIIKRLDKSYRQRYQVSLIENSTRLKALGAKRFLFEEREKWTCVDCAGVISLHDRFCSDCGKEI